MKTNFFTHTFYPWIAENFILRVGDWFLGTSFVQELKYWRKLDKFDAAAIKALQQRNLQHLLHHAVRHIPFYQAYAAEANQTPDEWLRSMPIMKKNDIKANLKRLIDPKARNLIVEKSSGSSGIQGEVYMTRQEKFSVIAIQTHLWEWSGYRVGMPLLQLGITPNRSRLKSMKDKLLRTTYQQAFDINEVEVARAFEKYKNKAAFFGGYASGVYSYALYAAQIGIKDVSFKAVISWGDKLFSHYREKIEKQFHTHVHDVYGCTEGIVIAGQCEHNKYHILTPHVVLEVLDKNGQAVPPGELGYVVVTRLDACAMPLIRYYLGDLAIKAPEEETCSCGKGFPILEKIIGRDTDIVRTRSGKMLIVHFFTGIFEHIPEIRQFSVIQKDLDSITIEYIPDQLTFRPDILQYVERTIQEKLNEDFPVYFQQVERIEPTNSGKPQIIQSFIEKSLFT